MKNNKNKETMVIIWVHIEKREYGVHNKYVNLSEECRKFSETHSTTGS